MSPVAGSYTIQRSGRIETSQSPWYALQFRLVGQLRLGVLALSACVALVGAAHAAQQKQAVFRVTFTGTLTKEWTYTDVDNVADCVQIARGSGSTTTRLSMRRPVRIRASAAGATRVRFSGSLTKIAGTVVRSGSRTVMTSGDLPCERRTVSEGRCSKRKASFRGASSAPRNPRRGILKLAPLRGARPARSPECPPEPRDVAVIRADLPLANGPLDVRDVFNRDIPRFFVSGNTTQETTLSGDLEGKVVERVRWTLVLTRVQR